MSGKTLFVSDLDGTLLQPGAFLSEETVRLLNNSIADGKLFTIATARTPATVSGIIRDVDMQLPAIVMTGASVWNPATNRYSSLRHMDQQAVSQLIDTFHRMAFPIFLFTLDNDMIDIYHIGGKLNELEQQFMDERIHSPYKRFHINASGEEILPSDLSKTILFYGMQPTAHAEATYAQMRPIANCRPQFYHDFYGPTIGIVEAFAPEATKANAILKMKHDTGADRVVAFGDNLNDLPMLRAADLAVAVENALPEVKEAADIVIGPNTDNSVARFIADYPNISQTPDKHGARNL